MDQEYKEYLIRKEAAEEGHNSGYKEGFKKGGKETTERIVSTLMENLNISKEKALELIHKNRK